MGLDDHPLVVPEHARADGPHRGRAGREPALAALLAGILAGMGIVALVFAFELLLWERARGVRLLSTPGLKTELYVREAGGTTEAAPPAHAS